MTPAVWADSPVGHRHVTHSNSQSTSHQPPIGCQHTHLWHRSRRAMRSCSISTASSSVGLDLSRPVTSRVFGDGCCCIAQVLLAFEHRCEGIDAESPRSAFETGGDRLRLRADDGTGDADQPAVEGCPDPSLVSSPAGALMPVVLEQCYKVLGFLRSACPCCHSYPSWAAAVPQPAGTGLSTSAAPVVHRSTPRPERPRAAVPSAGCQ